MKKTRKKVLGLFGLLVVVAITVIAALMPSPKTSAITTSVTDQIQIRVVSDRTDVAISGIQNGESFVHPKKFKVSYENSETVEVYIVYEDVEGQVTEKLIQTLAPGHVDGETEYDIFGEDRELLGEGFGYGKYTIRAKGIGATGITDEDLVSFNYVPVIAEAEEDEDTGKIYVNLDYDADDGTPEKDGKVAELLLEIYDENGEPVSSIPPIRVKYPTTRVELPFSDNDLPSDTYTIIVTPFNRDDEQIYTPSELDVDYSPVVVPDTGGLFKNLNISREDYLVTGLLIFFIFSIVGIGVIVRGDKNKTRKRK